MDLRRQPRASVTGQIASTRAIACRACQSMLHCRVATGTRIPNGVGEFGAYTVQNRFRFSQPFGHAFDRTSAFPLWTISCRKPSGLSKVLQLSKLTVTWLRKKPATNL